METTKIDTGDLIRIRDCRNRVREYIAGNNWHPKGQVVLTPVNPKHKPLTMFVLTPIKNDYKVQPINKK